MIRPKKWELVVDRKKNVTTIRLIEKGCYLPVKARAIRGRLFEMTSSVCALKFMEAVESKFGSPLHLSDEQMKAAYSHFENKLIDWVAVTNEWGRDQKMSTKTNLNSTLTNVFEKFQLQKSSTPKTVNRVLS